MRVLNVALNPPRLGRQTAPNPDQQYSPAEYLQWVPSTGTAARQYTFVANFIGTTMLPVTNLGEGQRSKVRIPSYHIAARTPPCLGSLRVQALPPRDQCHTVEKVCASHRLSDLECTECAGSILPPMPSTAPHPFSSYAQPTPCVNMVQHAMLVSCLQSTASSS